MYFLETKVYFTIKHPIRLRSFFQSHLGLLISVTSLKFTKIKLKLKHALKHALKQQKQSPVPFYKKDFLENFPKLTG